MHPNIVYVVIFNASLHLRLVPSLVFIGSDSLVLKHIIFWYNCLVLKCVLYIFTQFFCCRWYACITGGRESEANQHAGSMILTLVILIDHSQCINIFYLKMTSNASIVLEVGFCCIFSFPLNMSQLVWLGFTKSDSYSALTWHVSHLIVNGGHDLDAAPKYCSDGTVAINPVAGYCSHDDVDTLKREISDIRLRSSG
jgi:hypothetical protein